jgi:arsenite oxidase small subunit
MTTPSDDEQKKDAEPQATLPSGQNVTRRNLLRVGLTLGLVSMIAGIASTAKSLLVPANAPSPIAAKTTTPTVTKTVTVTAAGNQTSSASTSGETSTTSTSSSPFPRVMVAKVSDLVASTPVSFNYPLEETPNILVKLGVKAPGGVGPDGDIVAYSAVCQHLGCIYAYLSPGASPKCDNSYKAGGPLGYCCCHGSIFDLANGAKVLGGPSQRPVPQVTLQVDDSGNIYAIGMGPPSIFGHNTGSNDVLNDLQGGTIVSGQ